MYSFVIEVVIISWLCSRVYLYTCSCIVAIQHTRRGPINPGDVSKVVWCLKTENPKDLVWYITEDVYHCIVKYLILANGARRNHTRDLGIF